MYWNMLNTDFSQIKPISLLPRQYNLLVKEVKEKGAIVFLRRSSPEVVLVDFSLWQELERVRREKEEKNALASIEESEKEFKQGKAKILKSLKSL